MTPKIFQITLLSIFTYICTAKERQFEHRLLSSTSSESDVEEFYVSPFQTIAEPHSSYLKGLYAVKTNLTVYSNLKKQKYAVSLSLFTNQSFLVDDCQNFNSFECTDENSCASTKTSQTIKNPYFDATGDSVIVNVSLRDGYFWKSEDKEIPFINNCVGQYPYTYTDGIMGSIGLGVSNESNPFVSDSNLFSIVFPYRGTVTGYLTSYKNAEYTFNTPKKISTNQNWTFNFSTFSVLDDSNDTVIDSLDFPNGFSIFDLNMYAIGVPKEIYDFLIKELEKFDVDCLEYNKTKAKGATVCTYDGSISDLPTFRLNDFTIEPSIYARRFGIESAFKIWLYFVPTDTSIDLVSHLIVTEDFKDAVILGIQFFKNFYTVFNYNDIENPQVEFYDFRENVAPELGFLPYLSILSIPLAFLATWLCFRKQKVLEAEEIKIVSNNFKTGRSNTKIQEMCNSNDVFL